MFGEQTAKEIQLMLEYNPQPPFNSGHPSVADKNLMEKAVSDRKEIQEARRQLIRQLLGK